MFRSTALDTVISMQVVVGSRLTEVWERERGSVLGRQCRPEIGVAWFTGHDTWGRMYWSWESEVCCLMLLLTAHCRMIHLGYLSQWSLFWFAYARAVVHANSHVPFTFYLLYCVYLCYNPRHLLPHDLFIGDCVHFSRFIRLLFYKKEMCGRQLSQAVSVWLCCMVQGDRLTLRYCERGWHLNCDLL